jgi:hypothetical protein
LLLPPPPPCFLDPVLLAALTVPPAPLPEMTLLELVRFGLGGTWLVAASSATVVGGSEDDLDEAERAAAAAAAEVLGRVS